MKNILTILVFIMLPVLIYAQDMKTMEMDKKPSKEESNPTTYTCPMHPEIHEAKPGNCPKCGMKLVPEKSDKQTKTAENKATKQTDQGNKTLQDGNSSSISQKRAEENTSPPRVVRYDLYIRDTIVNFTGKAKRAIAVNGQIPMPTLTFTEGDTAEIYVHNELDEDTSLHWHGLFLPNQYDGVPNLTQMPIKPHTTHLYTFPIIQHGTHWYHSHTELQEQIGMYGSFIMNKRTDDPTFRKGIDDLPSVPIILSEWTDMKPENVHRLLHNASDWFAIKKGTTQSYAEAIKQGYFSDKIKNEWKRMNAMDVSDVYYDKFLINGKNENQLSQFKAGDKVRLRVSNGGASTYFWLTYAGGKITVVANDGNDVEPVEVDRLIIAVSETYDIVVTIPADKTAYEFLATPEDRTKSTSLYIGSGIKQLVAPLPKLKYFEGMKMMNGMMKMNGDLDDMGMSMSLNKMDMNVVMYPEITGETKPKTSTKMEGMKMDAEQYNANALSDITTLNYAMLKSPTKTTLPENAPVKELKFELTGNMNRYVWSLDNKVVSEADKILIKKGENVRIILHNNSMMRHPMHLHGHDFRVLNGQGEYAPLKNVIDIMPMETDTLEFNANVDGDWFFHCHILYHMMSGMGRVFTYENQPANPEIPNPKLAQRKLFADDRKFHFMAENDFATNGNDGEAMYQSTRWSIGTEWRLGYNDMHGYETETHIGRYIGKMQWLMPFIGFDWRYRRMGEDIQENNLFGQTNTKDKRAVVSLGVNYILPMLIVAQAEVFTDGKVRLQFERKDIPVSKRLRMNLMWNTDKEYMAGLRYIITRWGSLSSHYDSDMGFGAGFILNY
ncbi:MULTISPECIES: multicopper oxidase domain-containing protein [Flavobacterium]|uniref:Copper oxidase n=3 Tax=Flavobacterium TaxID=237 RepID=A0A0D0EFS5_9FLAO|nr:MULTISPECIES: multicopper oxidase domain-containing protein [Flavobacterium]KIO54614.1 multicopper oxidase [Flavobacterium hibernum]MBZ4035284.1 multicopper oxidase domain-containing protein [Flavobacterium potami]OXA84684.1 copper oxidase [Flavobacterium hibernum]RXM45481.1 copper oxidase [Flavobacterium sp. YO64]WET02487.1 multicopper oxidase domain-containing protein [Flavobacterium sp. YJ01]